MKDYLRNINFEIPTEFAQRKALFSAVKFTMSNYLSNAELQSIFTILGYEDVLTRQLLNTRGEIQNRNIAELIERCNKENKLDLLIHQLKILHPTIWYEHIWLLVRPRFYLPYKEGFYIQRFKQQLQITDDLSNSSSKLIVLRGINGIGKTALALEIARLSSNRKEFEGILWLELQDGKLKYIEKVYEWREWLHELAITFAWDFESEIENVESSQRYWDRLKNGNFLLCIDGMDDLNGLEELINFLTELQEGGNCKVIVTTILDINIKGGTEIFLGGFDLQETKNWVQQVSLSKNITAIKYFNIQQIEELHNNLAGIPLALDWYTSQLTSSSISIADSTDNLKSAPSHVLLKKLFDASFDQLSESAKILLLTLSIFNWPTTRDSWYQTTGVSEEEFDLNLLQLLGLSLIDFDSDLNLYSLYSIVRNYCEDKIRYSKISDKIYTQWIEYFISFSKNNGRTVRKRYDLIEHEWGNLWQAIRYVIEKWESSSPSFRLENEGQKYAHSLIYFATSLEEFLHSRGRINEELELLRAAAEAADALHLPAVLGPLTYQVGWLLCDQEKFQDARNWANWALDQLSQFGEGSGYAYRLYARIERMEITAKSELNIQHPSYAIIESHLYNAQLEFKNNGDQGEGQARVLSDWGRLVYFCKDYDKAYDYHLQALKHFRAIGEIDGEVNSLVNLGDTSVERKKFIIADEYYDKASKILGTSDFMRVRAEIQRGQAKSMLGQADSLASSQKYARLEHAYKLAQSAYETFLQLRSNADIRTTKQVLIDIEAELMNQDVEKENFQKEEKEKIMLTPQDQLAVGVLIEGTKFLFNELGRRLEFWRDKKTSEEKPTEIDVVVRNGEQYLRLDNIEKKIKSIDKIQIESSLGILNDANIILATYREDLGNPIITPDRKAFLRIEIPKLEKKLSDEGERLQRLIEQSLR